MANLVAAHDGLTFDVTQNLLGFFAAHRIRTTDSAHNHRWRLGMKIRSALDARFNSHTMLLSGDHVLKLGAFSYAFSPLSMYMEIGRYCSISWNVRIMGPQHATHFVTSSEILYRPDGFFADTFAEFGHPEWKMLPNPQPSRLTIGNDVWIGQDVLLKPGITIGDGAVIAAGSVVVKNVQPYEVVGGVPARRLKMRFSDRVINDLLGVKWWRFAIPALPGVPWGDPAAFPAVLQAMIDSGDATPFVSDLGSVRDVVTRLAAG